jgi:hypothetical protein
MRVYRVPINNNCAREATISHEADCSELDLHDHHRYMNDSGLQ